ncbi:hypothetical protein IHQ68_04490 [Chelatococcus sambhunathii]|uniref:Uncharacterized protein n=1 Tax=Chelatococcus sambhunathii TaxID=363953 RepID=A0ABU1DCX0_9HYPH|nr:hypothetical protein [Chelatococcus sambhunathii]MDR4305884.1 hypothetical protein [Chelatococcus sambhunathii]
MTRSQAIALRAEIMGYDKTPLLEGVVVGPIPDGLHDYELAIHMAGVKVIDNKAFGSYQGDAWFYVEFPNGERYFTYASYGSCCVCDAFESTFGYRDADHPDHAHRLASFGRSYLETCYTKEQAIDKAGEHRSWDLGADAVVRWIEETASRHDPGDDVVDLEVES